MPFQGDSPNKPAQQTRQLTLAARQNAGDSPNKPANKPADLR
ncbi:MAG: hypothetical protein ACRCUY_09520 [Thermoguttaceae bacterium]